jgi:hypothetical protein
MLKMGLGFFLYRFIFRFASPFHCAAARQSYKRDKKTKAKIRSISLFP